MGRWEKGTVMKGLSISSGLESKIIGSVPRKIDIICFDRYTKEGLFDQQELEARLQRFRLLVG